MRSLVSRRLRPSRSRAKETKLNSNKSLTMDIKRTLLWAVLTISGLMLYNNWLIYDGRQALFGPTPLISSGQAPGPAQASESLPPPASASQAPAATIPQPQKSADLPRAESLPTPQQAPVFNAANLASGEKHTIKNDVLELEINATGASVISAKLLKRMAKGRWRSWRRTRPYLASFICCS